MNSLDCQFCKQTCVISLPGAVAIVFLLWKDFLSYTAALIALILADCREMAGDWMKYIIVHLMKQLLNTVESCCLQVNRDKVTPRSNKAKIVQCPVLSCLFQAHWCKPPFSFSTLAFTGSERRSDGTELGKITVNHSHKPLRIRSCSNGITPLIRSRNFWAFFFSPYFLMNEPKSYTMRSHSFPPRVA